MNVSKHFTIISAICRVALASPSEALLFQIERLQKALEEGGLTPESKSLRALLMKAERSSEMAPRKLVPSRARSLPGEVLLPSTHLPADKETGARLVEVIFPDQLSTELPIFPDEFVRAMTQVVNEWRNGEELSKLGILPTSSCLLVGPPGTGKTSLAYWLAGQLGLPVVLARIDAMMSSFLGTSARNIAQVFSFANRFRCILVLDEFDSLAKMRDDPNEVGEIKRVVNALLQNLDNRKDSGVTIGITNHPKLLDTAVWRRFSAQIEVPLPDFKTRLVIAKLYSQPLEISEPELKFIAALLDGCSGAEIEDFLIAYKKRCVLPPAAPSPLAALRDIATLNSGRLSSPLRAVLFQSDTELMGWLRHNDYFELSLSDTSKIVRKGKSTVSRKTK
ncbi:AAA family ATPase [Undibacterium crateris]|uniref:AAA family ATPase n=1 Tax=Undibacterium crateris TaxID=2528175 RepID=UPI00138A222B|nr:ATP-binding protein [Undibacterium crateris]NDI85476.1 AAA family ATPase [Undibacterium crateris]